MTRAILRASLLPAVAAPPVEAGPRYIRFGPAVRIVSFRPEGRGQVAVAGGIPPGWNLSATNHSNRIHAVRAEAFKGAAALGPRDLLPPLRRMLRVAACGGLVTAAGSVVLSHVVDGQPPNRCADRPLLRQEVGRGRASR
ncbi:hypothetical protein ACE7GA_18655 [Roseomonas sp. CCTCC AB2023176]|uniref:hypothetical protein n=1 Tax=Roseomonas sp. CCTCC AB2023176 TaxID=3342640 RepID=UPI0035D7A6E3